MSASIRYCDIPKFLHGGEFYRNLSDDDPESIIDIPSECFVEDEESAEDLDEFARLLRVMLFWMLDKIPQGIIYFCDENEYEVWYPVVAELLGKQDSPILTDLVKTFSVHGFNVTDIIKTGRLELIAHAVERIDVEHESAKLATIHAANLGDLTVLTSLCDRGYPWHEQTCCAASLLGDLVCLEYIFENGCPWSSEVFDWFVWHESNAGTGTVEADLLEERQLACLQYAHNHGCPWNPESSVKASIFGKLSLLKFMHQNGLEWHAECCKAAAEFGQYDCLVFAHTHGSPWSSRVTTIAALKGHLDCLLYALEHACPVEGVACEFAARSGHIECLRLLHEYAVPWNEVTFRVAATPAALTCMQFMYDHHCPWDVYCVEEAASLGHLDHLRFLMERGCPYDDDLILRAIQSGHMHVVQYVVDELGVYMDEGGGVFIVALLCGQLPILQYLVDQSCPYLNGAFDSETNWKECDEYFVKENPDFVRCIEFAVERGWPINQIFVDYVCSRDLVNCVEYLLKEKWEINEPVCTEEE